VFPDQRYQEIGIYCSGRGIFHKTPRTGLEVGDKEQFLLKKGDFILRVTFAWEGAIAIVSSDEDGMYASTRHPTFRVDEARCEPEFLLQYFKTEDGLQQVVKICPGSAGRNHVLSIKRLSEVPVPLPPLAEQRRIVAQIKEAAAQINDARVLRQQSVEEARGLWACGAARIFEPVERIFPLRCLADVVSIRGGGTASSGALAFRPA
jgi:type I restriction enzyme, S subunit